MWTNNRDRHILVVVVVGVPHSKEEVKRQVKEKDGQKRRPTRQVFRTRMVRGLSSPTKGREDSSVSSHLGLHIDSGKGVRVGLGYTGYFYSVLGGKPATL